MGEDVGFIEFLADPWAKSYWQTGFGDRPNLPKELALLERIFPLSWLEIALLAPFKACPGPFRHQLPYHLLTTGGQTRLLECMAELLRHMEASDSSVNGHVPMRGRFRDADLYAPALSEMLVGPILRPTGDVTWQPQGPAHGADYRVDSGAGVLVAEVKRVWTSMRQEGAARERVRDYMDRDPSASGPLFTTAVERLNAQEDARRLYPRVRHAARQLGVSASRAVDGPGDSSQLDSDVPGILFLDLDGNSLLGNLGDWVERWMTFHWSRSIDLVLLFNHVGWNGTWDTVAQRAFSRTDRAWNALAGSLGTCSKGHLHTRSPPPGECSLPFL
jgi:hypothetical protein